MPLAPMGCAVQVHEKTDKRGTWAYHLVDGWYLATSPDHYRTHLCHIKSTKSDRFTDTSQFSHKRITHPTITHDYKIMAAIADCAKAIKNAGNSNYTDEIQQLIQLTEEGMGQASDQPSAKHTPAAPRGHPATNNNDRRRTQSMTERMQPVPRVLTQAGPRRQRTPTHHSAITPFPSAKAIKKRKRRQAAARLAVSPTAPEQNTRSRTKPAGTAFTRTRATATAMRLADASPALQTSSKAPSGKTNTRTNKS